MKAIVLSAGYGTRLGDLTRNVPKPMLPVAGRPLLEHTLRHLHACGFDEIAVNLHYRPERIREHFGDGSELGVRLTYAYEPTLLGTAGTLASLRAFVADEPFLVHYGDVLTDHDVGAMARRHARRQAAATLLVHERPGSNSVVVLDDDDRVVEFLERPAEDHPARARSAWVNSGLCLCEPEVLELVPAPPADLARDVLPRLVAAGGVVAEHLAGFRVAVDSVERYRQAEEALTGGAVYGALGRDI